MNHRCRVAALRKEMKKRKIPFFLTNTPLSIRYLCGFNGSAGLLLVGPGRPRLFLDGRYLEKGRTEARGVQIINRLPENLFPTPLYKSVRKRPIVGYDATEVNCATLLRWQQRWPRLDWQPVNEIIVQLRAIKEDKELLCLRQAGVRLQRVWQDCRPLIKPGMREIDIATLFGEAAFRHTGTAPSFSTIVAAGPNAAKPHHTAGSRKLQANEMTMIDIGICWRGYHVDMTRMLFFERIPAPQRTCWERVAHAQKIAFRNCRVGKKSQQLEQAVRKYFIKHRTNQRFTHSLGHGVGLAIHEHPVLASSSESYLKNQMAFTIEPGLYYPGRFGARIEDTVILRRGKLEIITPIPYEKPPLVS